MHLYRVQVPRYREASGYIDSRKANLWVKHLAERACYVVCPNSEIMLVLDDGKFVDYGNDIRQASTIAIYRPGEWMRCVRMDSEDITDSQPKEPITEEPKAE